METDSNSPRPTFIKRFIRGLFSWRIARRILVSLAILATLIVIFYMEENWRGKRAWENCKRELEAKGEVLDWNAYIPPAVPDDQNVFKAPKMTEWFVKSPSGSTNTDLYQKLKFSTKLSLPTPLAELTPQKAAEFLSLSAPAESDFDLIREALRRPHARMDGDYQQAFAQPIQNFINLRVVAQVLTQRGKCFLLLGQPENALREVTLLHDLSRLLEGKPVYLVTAMINVAITGLYAETVGDGLRLHAWREEELVVLQRQLQQIDLLPRLVESFRNERAGVCHMFEGNFRQAVSLSTGAKRLSPTLFFVRTWLYQNITTIALREQQIIETFDVTNRLMKPRKQENVSRDMEGKSAHRTPYTMLAAIVIPNYGKVSQTLARNQTLANEALIACALERHRLAHGEYPETLDMLAPQFIEAIPQDIIGGQPLHYRRTSDGRFLLYSVGWNETDDGGQVAFTKSGSVDREKGDWVWQYPSNH